MTAIRHARPAARWRLLALLVLLAAWALLVWRLNAVPPGLQHDEMFDARDALDVVHGQHAFYFPANFGREPLFMYSAAAILASLQNQIVWGLRFACVSWAMLGLAVTVVLARRYLSWPGALCAAAGMAGSFWFLFAGRLGLEPIPLVALGSAMLYWLDRGLAQAGPGRRLPFAYVAAGAAGGAAVYTYLAGRVLYGLVPLLLAFELWLAWRAGRALPRREADTPGRRPVMRGLLMTLAVMVIVGAPLLLYVASHPELADRRVGEVGGALRAAAGGDFGGLAANVWETAAAVLWAGPLSLPYQYSLPGRPALQAPWAVLFAAGLLVSIARALGFGRRRDPPARRHAFLLPAALLLALAPDLISGADALQMRGIIALPLLFILAAQGLWWAGARLSRFTIGQRKTVVEGDAGQPGPKWAPWAAALVVVGLLGWHVVESGQAYFVRWATAEPTQRIYNADWRAAAAHLNAHPTDEPVFLGTDRLMDLDELTYQLYGPSQRNVRWFHLSGSTPLPASGDALYLLAGSVVEMPGDLALLGPALRDGFTIPAPNGAYPLLRGFRLAAADVPGALRNAGLHEVRPAPVFGDWLQLQAAGLRDEGKRATFLARWSVLAGWPRPAPPPKLSVSLVDASGYRWAQADVVTALPYETWRKGEVFIEQISLDLPGDLPPGTYRARLLVYSDPARPLPVRGGDGVAASAPAVATLDFAAQDRGAPPAAPVPVQMTQAGPALTATGQWTDVKTLYKGVPREVRLTWEAGHALATGGLEFDARLTGPDGRLLWQGPANPVTPLPARWAAGQAYRLAHPVQAEAATGSDGPARLDICARQNGAVLSCAAAGQVQVVDYPPLLVLPQQPQHAAGASWDGRLALAGYDVVRAGQAVSLTLYWRTDSPPPAEWKRFVHALGPDGQIVAQADNVPDNRGLPMSFWRPGEYVVDRVLLNVPEGQAVAAFNVGLYDPETGVRVPLRLESGTMPEERAFRLTP